MPGVPNEVAQWLAAQAAANDPQNKSRIMIETPGVSDTQGTHLASPQEIQDERRRNEIKERGGAYSDRLKIEPKFISPPRTSPRPTDTDISNRQPIQKA
jgi:hypothetical protein